MALVTSAWATLRFRRSKDVKGWALLGIPQGLYLDVMQPLFERQTRFIEKHGRGEFVNVLFEAPVALAARLALAFPAPPSCQPLVVNQAGNRLLYGKFAKSAKARPQAQESEAWPGLKLLTGDESFWQVVTTLSNVTTLSLDRLHLSGENIVGPSVEAEPPVDEGGRSVSAFVAGQSVATAISCAAATPLHSLVTGGLKLQPVSTLAPRPEVEGSINLRSGAETAHLDEEGFEEDEWEDEVTESLEDESFDDIWDTDESEDFWDAPVESAPSELPLIWGAARSSPHSRALSKSLGLQRRNAYDQSAAFASASRPVASEEVEPLTQLSASQAAIKANVPPADTPASQVLGRYRSGLVPHASDANSLQVYNSGGLTIADAIARSRQQEEDVQAIAEQAQHRRIKLPFERSPTVVSPRGNPSQQGNNQRPNSSYVSQAPQLPEESWVAAAQSAVPSIEPAWEGHHGRQFCESWIGAAWEYLPEDLYQDSPERPLLRHNPWLPPSQQQSWEVESSPYSVADLNSTLVPVPADLVWLPMEEEAHGHILLQGVAVWNDWRQANPQIRPNLRGVYLNNLNLVGADLHDVDLRFALLFRADLREVDLSLASLQGADFIRADLAGASLWGAALGGAYLSHANLAGADLTQADLRGVYWQGAIWTGAVMPDGRRFEEQY